MKKIILTTLILSLLLLSGCSIFNKMTNRKQEPVITKNEYINSELDFRLKIPDSFGTYKTKVEKNKWTGALPVEAIVQFGLPTKDTNWPTFDSAALIFQIQIYKLEDWKKFVSNQPFLPSVIITSEKYVYTYRKSNDYPFDIKINETDFAKIMSSFALLDGKKIPNIVPKSDDKIPQGDD